MLINCFHCLQRGLTKDKPEIHCVSYAFHREPVHSFHGTSVSNLSAFHTSHVLRISNYHGSEHILGRVIDVRVDHRVVAIAAERHEASLADVRIWQFIVIVVHHIGGIRLKEEISISFTKSKYRFRALKLERVNADTPILKGELIAS